MRKIAKELIAEQLERNQRLSVMTPAELVEHFKRLSHTKPAETDYGIKLFLDSLGGKRKK